VDHRDVLLEAFGRLPELVRTAIEGLDVDQLCTPPGPEANTVAWLIWHLARVEDASLAELIDGEQVWVRGDWGPRFGIASDPANSGYGHSFADVLAIRPDSVGALTAYYDAAHARTVELVGGLSATDLDAVIDERWDPPVTLGVRLVSVCDDAVQHAGQAAYARGMLLHG
jgi:hypothetical protein